MKKLICMILLIAVLLSLCACGTPGNQETEPSVEATEETTEGQKKPAVGSNNYTPEQLYGHIDQTKPNSDGVYKIWSEVGVQNMKNDPAGTFELLCNIDMQGATLEPIGTTEKPFTGKINGANFIISNFTLEAKGGDALGFVGVNEGSMNDLQLSGMTITTDGSTKYAGSLAGINKGILLRCKATGTLTAETAADGVAIGAGVGSNEGEFTNSTITVDVVVASAGAANVGTLAGVTAGGKIEYVDAYSALTVTGENKTVGLFAGTAEGTAITSCAFMGADNSLNGQLFTNLTGSQDTSLVTGCVMRDNTPVEMTENERKLRETVVQKMYELCTIQWRVRESLPHDNGIWNKEYTYFGMPYKHVSATLSRLEYLIDEEGYLKDFVYDWDPKMLQAYMGTDCSTGVINALWTVSNSVDFGHCSRQYPWDETGGCLYVGDWEPDPSLSVTDSRVHIEYNGEEKIYESYALLKMGDYYVYNIPDLGGHTRMAAENAVVVRDQNGKIDPNYSYVTSHEQGWTTDDVQNKTYTSCRADHQYTFANLMYDGAVPVTCEELVTGEMEPAEATLTDSLDGQLGLITGTVKTNYYLDYIDMVITDSKGNEILNHRMFSNVGSDSDISKNVARFFVDSFDMARFATVLAEVDFQKGETYSYTITVHDIPGNSFLLKEDAFQYGAG